MSNIPPPQQPQCPVALVSRYESFAGLVKRIGLHAEDAPLLLVPTTEDVRGRHLICDTIDLELAAYASAVTLIPIALPEDVDTYKAPLELLVRFVGVPKHYVVRGSSTLASDQYKGGTTPVASLMADTLIKEFNLDGLDREEVADRIDSLLYDERRAGSETERMLLRMLTAAHDRRCVLELQVLTRGGNVVSPLTEVTRPAG